MKQIWISPSDLSYFWSDSKVGFYDKYVLEINRPKQAFPSVFNTIDLKMKDSFDKKNILNIVDNSPAGKIVHDEINVRSKLLTLGDFQIGFRGKIDCLVEHDDGRHSVVDYKTTHLSNKLTEIYYLQLMAYAYCLENPLDGEPKKINNLGLIVFEPKEFSHKKNQGSLKGGLHYVDIPFDKDKFKNWIIKELKPLLHEKRENLIISATDKSWSKYVNCFYVEEVEESEEYVHEIMNEEKPH
jgi:ATP-dependent helicase/DNAse subunit B